MTMKTAIALLFLLELTLKVTSFGSLDLSKTNPTSFGMAINGLSDQRLGSSVSSAGDVNGDGIKDVIITGLGEKAYVIYGRANEPIPYVDLAAGLECFCRIHNQQSWYS